MVLYRQREIPSLFMMQHSPLETLRGLPLAPLSHTTAGIGVPKYGLLSPIPSGIPAPPLAKPYQIKQVRAAIVRYKLAKGIP
jgi:hypothetical protein